MKWTPAECGPGDLIRVRLGASDHYGVFVSEEEVISFGYPPLPAFAEQNRDIRVVAVDIDTFACGRIVEVAVPEGREKRTRRTPDEAIACARARLGEGGYDLVRNNCEHFARECVFGERKSDHEEEVRDRWSHRPVLDVYVMKVGAGETPVLPASRERYIRGTRDAALRAKRRAGWQLLTFALRNSLGLEAEAMHFTRHLGGRWTAPEGFFSLAYAREYAVAAVSSAPVGIAAGEEKDAALAKKCVFKAGNGRFYREDRVMDAETVTVRAETDPPLVLAVAGGNLASLRWRQVQSGTALPLTVSGAEEEEL